MRSPSKRHIGRAVLYRLQDDCGRAARTRRLLRINTASGSAADTGLAGAFSSCHAYCDSRAANQHGNKSALSCGGTHPVPNIQPTAAARSDGVGQDDVAAIIVLDVFIGIIALIGLIATLNQIRRSAKERAPKASSW